MTEHEFWRLIEASLPSGNSREQAERLRALLHQHPREDCLHFQRQLRRHSDLLHTFDMKAASLLVHHGDAADVFRAFRAWLVCCGRERFEAARRDPEAIAGFLRDEELETVDGTLLLQAAPAVWEELGGYEEDFVAAFGNPPEPHFEADWPAEWEGFAARWPRLYERFCQPPSA